MKKLFLTLATIGLTLSVLGQGAVALDNSYSAGGVAVQVPGNYYNGVYGLELWMKNGTAADSAINSVNGTPAYSWKTYDLLTADGFTLQTHVTGLTMVRGVIAVPGGGFGPLEVHMPGVDRTVNGGNAVLGLVVWEGSGPSIRTAPFSGILTFVNPTSDYTIPPPVTPIAPGLDGWNSDLIFFFPEPSAFALAGLGAAVLLVFRRRCRCS